MPDIDLTTFFSQWPLGPDHDVARMVTASDGRELIQVRIEMGLLQLEVSGRPDGRSSAFATAESAVDADTAEDLLHEAGLHDYRGHLLLALSRHEQAIQDAEHVIRCATAARDVAPQDALNEAHRRGCTLRARAAAEAAAAAGRKDLAKLAIERGLTDLTNVVSESHYDSCNEVLLLRGMRDVLTPRLPSSQREELRHRLRDAIDHENYELAAILRNELRQMK